MLCGVSPGFVFWTVIVHSIDQKWLVSSSLRSFMQLLILFGSLWFLYVEFNKVVLCERKRIGWCSFVLICIIRLFAEALLLVSYWYWYWFWKMSGLHDPKYVSLCTDWTDLLERILVEFNSKSFLQFNWRSDTEFNPNKLLFETLSTYVS